MDLIHDNAQSFHFKGNDLACLLIHGFTGTPAEMRLLGQHLNKKGYTVRGVRLKGHGTTVEDMEKTTWKDWLASAEKDLVELKKSHERVIVIGLSMGGIIALNLASRVGVDGVVSIASPIEITNRKAYFAPILKYFKRYEEKSKKEYKKELEDFNIGYDKTPIASVSHLLKLIRRTKNRLKRIKAPILIIQSKDDNTVRSESADILFNTVGSSIKKLVYLKEGGHVIIAGPEREKAFDEIEKFFNHIGLE